jgi:hypothetical protein
MLWNWSTESKVGGKYLKKEELHGGGEFVDGLAMGFTKCSYAGV